MKRITVLSVSLILLINGVTGVALAAKDETVTMDQFEKAIAERDRIIIELLRRVEKLEKQITGTPEVTTEPENTGSSDEIPQSVDNSTTKPGTLQVDELTAQRALERGLVNEGKLLLGAGQMELVPNFSYQRFEFDGATAVQVGPDTFVGNIDAERDTLDVGLLFRHGLPWEAQFEASVPYRFVNSEGTTTVDGSIVSSLDRNGSGFGDLRLGLAKTLLNEVEGWPNLIGRITWDTSTGKKRDDDLALGFGFDEVEVSLTALTSRDPMVFFGTFAYQNTFEEDGIEPGDAYKLNLGTAVAVSPENSLTFSLSQSYYEELQLNGQNIEGSDRLASSFNIGLSTIMGPRTLLQLNVSLGLTEAASDYGFEISLPIRLDSPFH
jgi:hypothetical protein